MTVQFVQRAGPTSHMTIAAFDGAEPLLSQGQLRLSTEVPERERDERLSNGIALPTPGEHQPAGRLDRLEDAGHRDHALRRIHDQAIAATDLWLEQLDLAVHAFRPDPCLELLEIQPGREYPRGRRVEDAGDLQHRVGGRSNHRSFPF